MTADPRHPAHGLMAQCWGTRERYASYAIGAVILAAIGVLNELNNYSQYHQFALLATPAGIGAACVATRELDKFARRYRKEQ